MTQLKIPSISAQTLYGPKLRETIRGLAKRGETERRRHLEALLEFHDDVPRAWLWAAAERAPFAGTRGLVRLVELAEHIPELDATCGALHELWTLGTPRYLIDVLAVRVAAQRLGAERRDSHGWAMLRAILRRWQIKEVWVEAWVECVQGTLLHVGEAVRP